MGEDSWATQTIWTGDNLNIMRGMNLESVDLIYIDSPFNSKANYATPIGSQAARARFKHHYIILSNLIDSDEGRFALLHNRESVVCFDTNRDAQQAGKRFSEGNFSGSERHKRVG